MEYRLAIIGCGAVFSQFQLPALKKLNKIPIFFCDTNIADQILQLMQTNLIANA